MDPSKVKKSFILLILFGIIIIILIQILIKPILSAIGRARRRQRDRVSERGCSICCQRKKNEIINVQGIYPPPGEPIIVIAHQVSSIHTPNQPLEGQVFTSIILPSAIP